MPARLVQLQWSENRWQIDTGQPPQQGPTQHAAYAQPDAGRPVPTVGAEPYCPPGAAKWPNFPEKSIHITFTHPRTGAVESWSMYDPHKMQEPGAVAFDGYPRQAGDPDFTRRDVWVAALGVWGDVRETWDRFIWAEDVIAANPGVSFARRDGYDLRLLTYHASEVAKGRGKRGFLVLGAGRFYVPDFTDGYNDGIRLGSNNSASSTGSQPDVWLRGTVGCGPGTILTLDPAVQPTAAQVTMMRDDAPAGTTNQTQFMSGFGSATVTEPYWWANFTLLGLDLRDPADASKVLHWNGVRVVDSAGAVMERITSIGFAPGYKNHPPGETFTLTQLRADHHKIRDCLLDGRTPDGVRRSTSMIGGNGGGNADTWAITPSLDMRVERTICQYGKGGMMTFWLVDGVTTMHCETYSQGVGGDGLNLDGSGLNFEEAHGRARFFFPRHTILGYYSSDTSNPDKTVNKSQWISIWSRAHDTAADMVIWEPWHSKTDFMNLDARGRLVVNMDLAYQNDGNTNSAGTITHPMIWRGGRWLTGGDNIDMAALPTRTYVGVPVDRDFVVVR